MKAPPAPLCMPFPSVSVPDKSSRESQVVGVFLGEWAKRYRLPGKLVLLGRGRGPETGLSDSYQSAFECICMWNVTKQLLTSHCLQNHVRQKQFYSIWSWWSNHKTLKVKYLDLSGKHYLRINVTKTSLSSVCVCLISPWGIGPISFS